VGAGTAKKGGERSLTKLGAETTGVVATGKHGEEVEGMKLVKSLEMETRFCHKEQPRTVVRLLKKVKGKKVSRICTSWKD